MKTLTTLALAAALATSFAGASFAQSMSDSDKAMMTKCKGMPESAMKADQNCMAMMKANPDMMKSKDGMASPAGSNANPTPKSK